MIKKLLAAALLSISVIWTVPAIAQSSCLQGGPNIFAYKYVPTAGEWTSCLQSKQDVFGYTPLNQAGGTMTGKLTTAPSASPQAGFNVSVGTVPSSPQNGDIWFTIAGMFIQANGATLGPLGGSTANTPQVINLNSGSPPSPLVGQGLQVVGPNGTNAAIETDSYATSPVFNGVRTDGTQASPAAVVSGENAVNVNGAAWDGTVNGLIGRFHIITAENQTTGHHGSKACVSTTPLASVTIADGICQQPSGGETVGVPTGGDEGVGTLNLAGGLWLNGVAFGSANSVTNAQLTQANAGTIKGNPTASGPANEQDFTVASLQTLITGDPLLDYLMIQDHVSGALEKTTQAGILSTVMGTTRGMTAEYGASGWQGVVPGTAGYAWTSNGPGADPTWQPSAASAVASFNGRTGAVVPVANDYATIQLGTTISGSAPTSGLLGEVKNSTVLVGSAVSAGTTGSSHNVTSISLSAGSWSCSGNIFFALNAVTAADLLGWVSLTSATQPTAPNSGSEFEDAHGFSSVTTTAGYSLAPFFVDVSTTTPVYLSFRTDFSAASSLSAYGALNCLRRD